MTRTFKHGVKRGLTAVVLAAALSTLGPAASSFLAFSSAFRPHIPEWGGTSIVYKNGQIPGWIIDAMAGRSTEAESALNGQAQPRLHTVRI